MNDHRRMRLWTGFAAVAAIGLVATWLYNGSGVQSAPGTNHDDVADAPLGEQSTVATRGRATRAPSKNRVQGTPAAAEQNLHEQEEARALTAQHYKEAQHSPNRLEWAPEEVRPSDTVFDLCDDEQAKEAGLAFNALDEDRHNLGIDCSTSKHRFAYIPPNEAMRLTNSYDEATNALKEFAEKGEIKGEKFSKPVGMLMGHRGPWPEDIGLALDPCGAGFGCARASFYASNGTTRGVFANVSKGVAHNVTVSVGNLVARYPLSVQPGESTAFELPGELSTDDLAALTITATFVPSADPRRSVLLLGVPGDITGPREQIAGRFGVDLSGGPPELTYTSETLTLERSTNHPAAAQDLPDQVLDEPIAVVALLDEQKKVIAVLRLPVTLDEETGGPVPVSALVPSKLYAIGFVSPPEAAFAFKSVGGAE